MRVSDVLRSFLEERGHRPVDIELEERLKRHLDYLMARPSLDAIVGDDQIHIPVLKPKDDEAFRLFDDESEPQPDRKR